MELASGGWKTDTSEGVCMDSCQKAQRILKNQLGFIICHMLLSISPHVYTANKRASESSCSLHSCGPPSSRPRCQVINDRHGLHLCHYLRLTQPAQTAWKPTALRPPRPHPPARPRARRGRAQATGRGRYPRGRAGGRRPLGGCSGAARGPWLPRSPAGLAGRGFPEPPAAAGPQRRAGAGGGRDVPAPRLPPYRGRR